MSATAGNHEAPYWITHSPQAQPGLLERAARFLLTPPVSFRIARTDEPQPDARETGIPAPPEYPVSFDGVVGQAETVTLLKAEVAAARREPRALRHLLLYGPPGCGKSLLGYVLAHEAGCLLYESSGAEYPTQQTLLDACAAIGRLWAARLGNPTGVLWLLDEADALPRTASYALHSLMTHGWVTWQGQRFGGVPISLVLTTNRMSRVPPALRSRCAEHLYVDFLGPAELAEVARRAAARMGVPLDEDAAEFLGQNAAGEGRKVLHLLGGARNLADHVTLAVARQALALSGLRHGGLSRPQFEMLSFLAEMENRTAGLNSIAAFVGVDPADLQGSVEAFLIRSRLVQVTRGGRRLTQRGIDYLKGASELAG